MSESDDIPELRLAPVEAPEELARRAQREQRRRDDSREQAMEFSLKPFRVGSVPYLNSVPLTRGLETEVEFMPPAQLAVKLDADELDAALVSITEVLFHDRYDVLDGIAVASLGEVYSVFLAHRIPLDEVTEIWCDPASLTSVNLLKVLLSEGGQKVKLQKLDDYANAADKDAVLLIGNPAIDFRRADHDHAIWDLGAAWHELTKLPFVFAIWALRRGLENDSLRGRLREARDFGMDTLDYIIDQRTDYDRDFRKDYLGWHIHFHLGADEKRGVARFVELLKKHQDEEVFAPRYVV
ncbi:MAG: menaquinone biosynthesis protein [Limisphaerales bacterium]